MEKNTKGKKSTYKLIGYLITQSITRHFFNISIDQRHTINWVAYAWIDLSRILAGYIACPHNTK